MQKQIEIDADRLAKNPTFTHLFGGWHSAEACRWKNPDGSEGGIVATSATVNETVTLPATVEVWPDAKIIGDGASIGDGFAAVHAAGVWMMASLCP